MVRTKNMKKEIYFCLYLTENEHFIIENELKNVCNKLNLKLQYYRKLKDGHVPTYREVKIIGDNINKIKKYIKESKLYLHITKNPHKDENYWRNI